MVVVRWDSDGWGPEGLGGWGAQFHVFFFRSFSLSPSWGSSGVLKRRNPEMCTFGVLGLSCETHSRTEAKRNWRSIQAGVANFAWIPKLSRCVRTTFHISQNSQHRCQNLECALVVVACWNGAVAGSTALLQPPHDVSTPAFLMWLEQWASKKKTGA